MTQQTYTHEPTGTTFIYGTPDGRVRVTSGALGIALPLAAILSFVTQAVNAAKAATAPQQPPAPGKVADALTPTAAPARAPDVRQNAPGSDGAIRFGAVDARMTTAAVRAQFEEGRAGSLSTGLLLTQDGEPAEPACPKCQGRMWDNRESKRNPKAPDFKCRDRACDGVYWPDEAQSAFAKGTMEFIFVQVSSREWALVQMEVPDGDERDLFEPEPNDDEGEPAEGWAIPGRRG